MNKIFKYLIHTRSIYWTSVISQTSPKPKLTLLPLFFICALLLTPSKASYEWVMKTHKREQRKTGGLIQSIRLWTWPILNEINKPFTPIIRSTLNYHFTQTRMSSSTLKRQAPVELSQIYSLMHFSLQIRYFHTWLFCAKEYKGDCIYEPFFQTQKKYPADSFIYTKSRLSCNSSCSAVLCFEKQLVGVDGRQRMEQTHRAAVPKCPRNK